MSRINSIVEFDTIDWFCDSELCMQLSCLESDDDYLHAWLADIGMMSRRQDQPPDSSMWEQHVVAVRFC